MRKAEDKEKAATVEADKVKEENLAVVGERCSKKVWLKVLQKTGDYFYLIFKNEWTIHLRFKR